LVSILIVFFSNTLEKRTYKQLYKYYEEEVIIEQTEINVPNGTLYEVIGKTDRVYIGYSPSKFENFDFMVILNCDNKIKLVKILIYRENYGGEIGSKRWLKQFIGMNKPKPYVDAISGATISVNSLKFSLNNLISQL
jgi:major membrane immunogen (membrane-anchored lipoprotein)